TRMALDSDAIVQPHAQAPHGNDGDWQVPLTNPDQRPRATDRSSAAATPVVVFSQPTGRARAAMRNSQRRLRPSRRISGSQSSVRIRPAATEFHLLIARATSPVL